MNRHESTPAKFRLVAALGAALLTVATFAVSIQAPASLSPVDRETGIVAQAPASTPATEVTIAPSSIEVVGYREKTVAAAPAPVVER